MKTKSILLIAIITSAISINSLIAQTSNLLFESSFNNVTIDKSVSWKHVLTGTDPETNFTFPDDLPGNWDGNYFNYVSNISNYDNVIVSDVVSTIGMDGNPTNALYIEFIEDDPTHSSRSRVQYVMLGDESSSDPVQRMNKGYAKCKMKIHLDKNDNVDYFLPIEWKDTGDDGFRLGFYVYDSNSSNPYYVVKGQYMINGGLGQSIWQYNSDMEVIEDEWFEIEYYWFANSNETEGRLQVAINGEILFDVTEQTKDPDHEDRMYYFMPFKVYGTKSNSYITDFEYRDNVPQSSILSGQNLSVTDHEVKSKLNLYPIPTQKTLNFSKDYLGFKFQIYTVTGETIKKGSIKTESINVSTLSNGVYFIKFKNEALNIERFAKFVKN